MAMVNNRRQFIKKSVFASVAVTAGVHVVFGKNLPDGIEVIRLLLSHGADVDLNREGMRSAREIARKSANPHLRALFV